MSNPTFEGTRVVNRRKEKEDIYIGRGGSHDLGNPFTHLPQHLTKAEFQASSREDSIAKFEAHALDNAVILSKIDRLRGKKLGCYCDPEDCHGAVYVVLVATYDWMRRRGIEPDWYSPKGRGVIRGHYRHMKTYLSEIGSEAA